MQKAFDEGPLLNIKRSGGRRALSSNEQSFTSDGTAEVFLSELQKARPSIELGLQVFSPQPSSCRRLAVQSHTAHSSNRHRWVSLNS